MKRKFTDRVALERRVLSLVNRCSDAPLNGLTQVAIDNWVKGNMHMPAEILNLVKTIAIRARIDVDGSREVFTEENVDVKTLTEEYVLELEKVLARA
jgi:hypothetical protein